MTLPKVDRPIYSATIISHPTPVKFTPYTVKESKILMMARDAGEIQGYIDALKQLLQSCLITKLDVDKLPLVDIEWLFLNLQARSVGEKLPLYFKCTNHQEDGNLCGMTMELEVDLLNVEVVNKGMSNIIMLTDTVGIKMKFPSFEVMKKIIENKDEFDTTLAALCIESVFDGTSVYKTSEMEDQEIIDFVEGLTAKNFTSIEEYMNSTPVIKYEAVKECPRCKYKHEISLEGLEDFFE